MQRASEQLSRLVRDEIALAKAELAEKGKHAGIGIGLFGGGGVLALYGMGALVATLIIVLDLFLPLWLAALIVTVTLFLVAGVLGLIGKSQVTKAVPPEPKAAIESVKADVDEVSTRSGSGAGHERRRTGRPAGQAGCRRTLRAEIKQTRAELGETVQALAAKADVKARAKEQVELTKAAGARPGRGGHRPGTRGRRATAGDRVRRRAAGQAASPAAHAAGARTPGTQVPLPLGLSPVVAALGRRHSDRAEGGAGERQGLEAGVQAGRAAARLGCGRARRIRLQAGVADRLRRRRCTQRDRRGPRLGARSWPRPHCRARSSQS